MKRKDQLPNKGDKGIILEGFYKGEPVMRTDKGELISLRTGDTWIKNTDFNIAKMKEIPYEP